MISAHMSSSLRNSVFSPIAGPAFLGPVPHQPTLSGHAKHSSGILAFQTLPGTVVCWPDDLAVG